MSENSKGVSRIEAVREIEAALQRLDHLSEEMRQKAAGNTALQPRELLLTGGRIQTEVKILRSQMEQIRNRAKGQPWKPAMS